MSTAEQHPGSAGEAANDSQAPRARAHCGLVAEDDWHPFGIDDLEPAAWDALKDTGSTAVIAGPGAGKTEFLAQRAAFLLQTGRCRPPQKILAISYKRSSAINLGDRVAERLPDLEERLTSLTFDSFTKGLLDRFAAALPSVWALHGPYEIVFFGEREIQDFLHATAGGAPPALQWGIRAIPPKRFLADIVGQWELPDDPSAVPSSPEEYAAWAWWSERYLRDGPQYLDFNMINRLAELVTRATPQLQRALRVTYPFVFVDEFQDTNGAQLSLLRSLFLDSAVVTAVGDRKQRIMGFAGALEYAIDLFRDDFAATLHQLAWNFRSSTDLVALQHVVAQALDPRVVQPVSKARVEPGHVAASLWTFSSRLTESTYVANWIADDIASSGRRASDFVLVAKQKVAELEPALAHALNERGIALRNDDARYGTTSLQDLTAHELTKLVVGVLRLAAQPAGLGQVWLATSNILAKVRGEGDDETSQQQLDEDLSTFTAALRRWLGDNDISNTDPNDVVQRAAAIATEAQLRAFVAARHRGEDADELLASLAERLARVLPHANSWIQAFLDIDAEDAVSLMTVHRSKGLEYHTVFFVGLDDEQWWAHDRDREGSTAAFFVGLSRAAYRLVFTCTAIDAARNGKISELYDLLDAAGVQETRFQ